MENTANHSEINSILDYEELLEKDFLKKYFEEILNKLKHMNINPLPYEVINFFVKNRENIVNLDENILQYFSEINAIAQSVIKKENMCNSAVKIGSLNLLKAAIENGYSVIKYGIDDTFYCAIKHGDLPCIEYLMESKNIKIQNSNEYFDIDYYYDDFENYEEIYNTVASKGYIDVLIYLHNIKFGIKFARQILDENELTNGALWCGDTVCVAAANGHKHILEYLSENYSYRDSYPTYHAAAHGQKECLLYLNENGYYWDSTTCSHAARGGHLNILTLLFENGCPWTKHTCEEAARNGHEDCLMYAHQNGCPIDHSTVLIVVMNGRIECFKYIVEHISDEWKTESITKYAAQYGHLNCLKYAIECGCPMNKEECLKVAKGDCQTYILEN
uniref:Uncharacterized protein n=1 Tax=viral metagenome TaxID=1070528 RepID=A0A6C0DBC4_9ZZZZ